MVWRLMLPDLGAICSVVSYHVEPQILEMLANSDFLVGNGRARGLGFHYTRELAWLRHL